MKCRCGSRVNGQVRDATVEPRVTLADFLREQCHLTGTHLGCEHGVCGACTVLVDGAAVRACLVFAVQADGADSHHDRGHRLAGRRALSRAVGVPRLPRAAVRLLHARLRRLGDRVPARQPEADRPGDPRGVCPATSAAAPATRASCKRCTRRRTRCGKVTRDDRSRRRPARLGMSARASTASRTRRLLTGARHLRRRRRRCRGCCTRASCAARFPRATIRGIDTSAALAHARGAFRVHGRRPEPGRQGAVAHVDRRGESGDAPPAARRRRGPLRRRSGRARRRRQPRARRGRGRAGRGRLRAACPPSSTTPMPSTPTCSSTKATAPTSSARSPVCPPPRSRTCSPRPRTSRARRSSSRRTRRCRWKGAGWSSTTRARRAT